MFIPCHPVCTYFWPGCNTPSSKSEIDRCTDPPPLQLSAYCADSGGWPSRVRGPYREGQDPYWLVLPLPPSSVSKDCSATVWRTTCHLSLTILLSDMVYYVRRYFECNYGESTIPLDKWFGTFHDGITGATYDSRSGSTDFVVFSQRNYADSCLKTVHVLVDSRHNSAPMQLLKIRRYQPRRAKPTKLNQRSISPSLWGQRLGCVHSYRFCRRHYSIE
eukprot:SAG31_NODE_49_length_30599_cov_15.615016_35_plen_218_part_00